MKKTISKRCLCLDEAETFMETLYDKYNYVRLVSSPNFHPAGEGTYVWEIAD